MNSILLVDGNPLMWRAIYSRDESYITEGVSKYVFKLLSEYESSDILLFWDSGKSRIRSTYYPDYKIQRDEKKATIDLHEVGEQKKLVSQYLSHFGIRSIKTYGVEADDLISWFSEYFSKVLNYDKVIIVSRDRDFFQLVNDNVVLLDYLSGDLYDKEKVEDDFGVSPDKVVDLKALVGDVSDNIKGVRGIGDKTAIKLLSKFGDAFSLLSEENFDEVNKSKTSQKVLRDSDSLKLSYQLVQLPTLAGASAFLNSKELYNLEKELEKEVKADFMLAQLEGEALQLNVSTSRCVSPLRDEVLGILPYLTKTPPQNPTSLAQLDSAILNCQRCARRSCCQAVILAEGFSNSPVMVVSDQPLAEKDRQKLLEFLSNVGLTLEECWVTSVCKCSFSCNEPAKLEEIFACSEYLRAEISLLKPKFVITFGSEAMSLFTPYGADVANHCGEILNNPVSTTLGEIGAYVGIMVHPSSVCSGVGEANFSFGEGKIKEFLDERKNSG